MKTPRRPYGTTKNERAVTNAIEFILWIVGVVIVFLAMAIVWIYSAV